jgi:hypothetical protein
LAQRLCTRATLCVMVKIYALRERLEGRRTLVSDAIQAALSESFGLPNSKRAHRFFPLAREDLIAATTTC